MYHHRRVVTGQPLDYIELLSEVVYIDAPPMSRGLDEATDLGTQLNCGPRKVWSASIFPKYAVCPYVKEPWNEALLPLRSSSNSRAGPSYFVLLFGIFFSLA